MRDLHRLCARCTPLACASDADRAEICLPEDRRGSLRGRLRRHVIFQPDLPPPLWRLALCGAGAGAARNLTGDKRMPGARPGHSLLILPVLSASRARLRRRRFHRRQVTRWCGKACSRISHRKRHGAVRRPIRTTKARGRRSRRCGVPHRRRIAESGRAG